MATLRQDPTQTRAIERRWVKDINRRWRSFTATALDAISSDGFIFNALDVDPSQIRIYMNFLQQQIDAILLGARQAPNWQAQYQLQAYEKAIERARAQLRRQGADIPLTVDELQQASTLTVGSFTATPSIGGLTSNPIHQEALSFLYTRSYDSLKGHTDKMAREVREILFDGVKEGRGVDEVKRSIRDRIGVSQSGAKLIAQTETIQAYQRSQINQAEIDSDNLGETIQLRWLTRRDGRVRELHASFHGRVMTQEEAYKNINKSPFNCRCALTPVIEEADTEEEQLKFDKQRKELLELQ